MKPFTYAQIELLILNGSSWNNLTVCHQMSSNSSKYVTYFIHKSHTHTHTLTHTHTHTHTHTYIYIYIYIYIMRVLIVSKSLCGYVSNHVQYNMERAQYLEYSYYITKINKYIYIYNPWKIFCNPEFHEFFSKTTIIRQLRR